MAAAENARRYEEAMRDFVAGQRLPTAGGATRTGPQEHHMQRGRLTAELEPDRIMASSMVDRAHARTTLGGAVE